METQLLREATDRLDCHAARPDRRGVRACQALGVHVEDLTLTVDDEHVTVHGKRGKR